MCFGFVSKMFSISNSLAGFLLTRHKEKCSAPKNEELLERGLNRFPFLSLLPGLGLRSRNLGQ